MLGLMYFHTAMLKSKTYRRKGERERSAITATTELLVVFAMTYKDLLLFFLRCTYCTIFKINIYCTPSDKKLSCCCDSRSYCVRRTVYWQTIKPVSDTSLQKAGTHNPILTGRVYEHTQTLSIQA